MTDRTIKAAREHDEEPAPKTDEIKIYHNKIESRLVKKSLARGRPAERQAI